MADRILVSSLFPDARAFLAELGHDNTRAWFGANKARYDSQLKRPAERLLADVALWLAADLGAHPRTKLFRPHRDMRFTEDKTPYHTHLHMMWSLPDGRAWMLGIAPDYATLGAGVMTFSTPQQERYLAAVASAGGKALPALLTGWRSDDPTLDHVPAPYPEDHPRAGLLRHTGLVAWADNLEEDLTRDPYTAITGTMSRARPLMDWLARIV
ncbi:TIGR02453 family protein [Sagittula salina]|uniref:TIGR02453 family protein n=1 Tax=Sagittula salina TaxID=2820268 RepID=A0A940S1V7_9RHOB|nr:TIGR02453 family protein [Sagittula salina]MBP0481354.1 TIGR02453 family protein [Sagittula salina]